MASWTFRGPGDEMLVLQRLRQVVKGGGLFDAVGTDSGATQRGKVSPRAQLPADLSGERSEEHTSELQSH